MTAGTEGIVRYDVTRLALIEALGSIPLGEFLHLEARGRMADALLARIPLAPEPVAAPEAEARADEREVIARLADNLAASVPVQGGVRPFSTFLRPREGEPLPEASGAAFYMDGVQAERERIAELADEHGVSYARNIPGGEFEYRPFADLIREQP